VVEVEAGSGERPGSLIPLFCAAGDGDSLCSDFRYAAEPRPLSCVCLNQFGSFEPSAAAISFLEGASSASFSVERAGLDGGSAETPLDNGRERTDPMPRERGRCCHESVPLLDRVVTFAGAKPGDSDPSMGGRGNGLSGSSVGDRSGRLLRVGLSSGRLRVWARDRGVSDIGGSIEYSTVGRDGDVNVVVAAGPVLTGDIERARSMKIISMCEPATAHDPYLLVLLDALFWPASSAPRFFVLARHRPRISCSD
jgi:hypothetical protein